MSRDSIIVGTGFKPGRKKMADKAENLEEKS